MKYHPLALLISFLVLSGCSGVTEYVRRQSIPPVERRIEDNPEFFSALSDAEQQRAREGKVELGDSIEFVTLALGEPRSRIRRVTSDGEYEIWTYFDTQHYSDNETTQVKTAKKVDGEIKETTKDVTIPHDYSEDEFESRVVFQGDEVVEYEYRMDRTPGGRIYLFGSKPDKD